MPKTSRLCGSLAILVAVTTLATGGCSSSSDRGVDGSGVGSGGTGSNTYTRPICGQTCQDFLVAHALNDTIWFAWDQNLARRPAGPQDAEGTCPLGGTVHVTGTSAVSNGLDIAHLAFEFMNCANSDKAYTLTFTGSVMMDGSFDSVTEFAALTFSSASLEVAGALDYLDDPQIAETCGLSCAQEGAGDSWKLRGQVCNRMFNSETALNTGTTSGANNNGGSNGSGGNATAGSSTSSTGGQNGCRCSCPDGSDCTNATQPNPCGVDANGIPDVCGCPLGC